MRCWGGGRGRRYEGVWEERRREENWWEMKGRWEGNVRKKGAGRREEGLEGRMER